MFGITPYMIRALCESELKGGGGYSPREIAQWTPDQVWFRIASLEDVGKLERKNVIPSYNALAFADEKGNIRGRAADGTKIVRQLNKNGKSYAGWLLEQEKLKQQGQKGRRRGTRTR